MEAADVSNASIKGIVQEVFLKKNIKSKFLKVNFEGPRTICNRRGLCRNKRRRPPPNFDGLILVPGTGQNNIPPNIPCPFYSRPQDAFSGKKCQRIFCRQI